MNVLVIAPHPDDEAIGCGGAIRLHVEAGDRVGVVFLTSGERGIPDVPHEETRRIREAEALAAAGPLGHEVVAFLRLPDGGVADHLAAAAGRLAAILAAWRPAQIYLPHPEDAHPDHEAALPIVRAALPAAPEPAPWLLGYEVWTPMRAYDHVQDISAVIDAKLAGIRAYPSQLATFDYARAAEGLNRYRGTMAGGCAHAEAMQTLG